jgi:long-chain acyl-CoA synthetase
VFGVPNEDLGEEVKAVVQPMPGNEPGPALERELIEYCSAQPRRARRSRARWISPTRLPRLPTGKLYKKALRDKYWGDRKTRIV